MHRNYKRLLDQAGLPAAVRIHDLRHTHYSALLNAGVPLATVAERGGYRNANVLLSVYAHAQVDGQRAAAAVAGKLIGGGDRAKNAESPAAERGADMTEKKDEPQRSEQGGADAGDQLAAEALALESQSAYDE